MPVGIDGNGIITGVSDFSSSNVSLTDPEITGGIYLGGTGSANYLDDYEEGTFTPFVINDGTTSYDSTEGTYTKIGKSVFFSLSIVIDAAGGSGDFNVTGLPFSRAGTGPAPGVTIAIARNFNTASAYIRGYINPGNTTITLSDNAPDTGYSSVTWGEAGSSPTLFLSGVYETDS